MEQFKVLSRFSRYLSVEAAVSDIPQKLKDAANKHWYNGFKGFVQELYLLCCLFFLFFLQFGWQIISKRG